MSNNHIITNPETLISTGKLDRRDLDGAAPVIPSMADIAAVFLTEKKIPGEMKE